MNIPTDYAGNIVSMPMNTIMVTMQNF